MKGKTKLGQELIPVAPLISSVELEISTQEQTKNRLCGGFKSSIWHGTYWFRLYTLLNPNWNFISHILEAEVKEEEYDV